VVGSCRKSDREGCVHGNANDHNVTKRQSEARKLAEQTADLHYEVERVSRRTPNPATTSPTPNSAHSHTLSPV
jgi:hypothetical protein